MSIESELSALTTATTNLLSAVNVSKNTLDTSIAAATASATLIATGAANAAASSANTALSQAQIAASTAGSYPNSAASVVPTGVTAATITAAGSAGANGTFPLGISGGGGSGAQGTFTVAGGVVTAVTVTAPGYGYTSAPTLALTGSTGLTGATATSTISALVPSGKFYWATSTDGLSLNLYQNASGVATIATPATSIATKAGVDAQTAAIAATVSSTTSSLIFGRPTSVVSGTNVNSQQSYVFNTSAPKQTIITQVQGHFGATGSIQVLAVSLVGSLFVPRRGSQRTAVVTATGDQTYSLSSALVLQPGEYLAFKNSANAMFKLVTAAGDSGGYYNSNAGLVTNTTLNTTSQIQIRFAGTVLGDILTTGYGTPDAAISAGLLALLGDNLSTPYENAKGGFGAFVATAIVGTSSIYCHNEPQSGKPSGVQIETSSGGTGAQGKVLQIATSGEVLASANVDYYVGSNYFDATMLAGMVDHPSWIIGFEPSASGGRTKYLTAAGWTNISFAVSQSHNVGDTVTFATPSSASLSIKVYSTKTTVLNRLATLESASTNALMAKPVPLASGYTPALMYRGALNHIIGDGQSNVCGEDAIPLLYTAPSTRHYKFGPGLRATPTGLSGANPSSTFDNTLMPLVEDNLANLSSGVAGETFCTSLAIHATRRLDYYTREQATFLMSVAGRGATNIAGLAAAPGWFTNIKAHIDQGIARAKALGVEYQVVCVVMDHGEADSAVGTTGTTYYATAKAMMETLQAYYQAQTAAAGGSVTAKANKIIWLWSQATKEAANASQKGVDTVANAQLRLCDDLPYCVYYGPAYRYPYINGSHHTAKGQALKGAGYLARALSQLLQGHKPDCVRWGTVTYNSATNKITANLTAPSQIQLSTAIIGALTQYGMAASDDTGAITLSGFAVSAGQMASNGQIACQLTCTPSRTLGASPLFRAGKDYALSGNPLNGGFTNIQDSTAETVTLADASTHALAHFAPVVTIPISTYE